MTSANLVIGLLILGLVIYRQLIPRRVKSNMRIPLILGVIGLFQVVQYLAGHQVSPIVIAEIVGSLVLAAVFGFARASTVRLSFREGQWWSQGTWLTAILWIASLAAHLGFDFVVGGKGSGRQLRQRHDPGLPRGDLHRAATGRPGPFAAAWDPGPGRIDRFRLTGPARRTAWLVVYPEPGVRHDESARSAGPVLPRPPGAAQCPRRSPCTSRPFRMSRARIRKSRV